MAEEYVIRLVGGGTEVTAKTTGGGGGGGGGSLPGMLGKLGSAAGVIGMIAGQLSDVIQGPINSLLGPIKGILKAIVQLVGELLRPIAQVIMIVLQPFLFMLRPLIQMFRTFMAPFMRIAQGFARLSQERMAAGDMAGAFQMSMEAFNTIIGPFIVSIVSIGLQLATSLLIGSIVLIIDMILALIQNVVRFIPVVGERMAEGIQSARDGVRDFGTLATNTINGQIQTATMGMLNAMQTNAEEKLAYFQGKWATDINSALVETPEGAMSELQVNTDTAFNPGIKSSIPSGFNSGLSNMQDSTKTFTNNIESYATRIKNALAEAQAARDSAKESGDTQIGLINIHG